MSQERPVRAAFVAMLFLPLLAAAVPVIPLDSPPMNYQPAVAFTVPRAPNGSGAANISFSVAARGPVIAFSTSGGLARRSNPVPLANKPDPAPSTVATAKPVSPPLNFAGLSRPAPQDNVAPQPASSADKFVNPFVVTTPPPVAAAPVRRAVDFSIPKYVLTQLERDTIATCLVLEAASQGEFGMRGVMAVIRNRAHGLPELFAPTVLEEKQFSALNQLTAGRESLWRVMTRARRDHMWTIALEIVDEATKESWQDPTEGATHYTRTGERTPWTRALARTVTIGRHAFYR